MAPRGYRPGYDPGDSRRSPRDQSPVRYNDRDDRMERNDRDEYRGGSHTSDRRRSIPDIRSNNNAFNSNRDTFREPMSRESTRDFPPRDPPRGPKGLIDAPTGPRASSYSSDFRGDRGDYGYRGDYRGDRGRGRARGWRDDSRDRLRDLDRNYRRDRDDRGPPHFRDEPGRERWGREPYNRGRRSSPQGRGRSPTYGPRDTRDAPPNIEIDRARRGSRDGPLSGGSPSSESVGFSRGFGRAPRGSRGRGRGYYDDHRRSRSPEPGWSRRTQPSATPPPQVPAFGSNVAVSGPLPGVTVPTAPRYERVIRRGHGYAPSSVNLAIDNSKKEEPANASQLSRRSPSIHANKDRQSAAALSLEDSEKEPATNSEKSLLPTVQTDRKRKPIIGKRLPKPTLRDISDIEDSGDDLDDSYFEEEMTKAQQQIEQVLKDNPLMPREDPEAPFLKPFIDVNIDELPSTTKLVTSEPCVAPKVNHEAPVPESEVSSNIPTTETSAPRTLASEPRSKGKSRSVTPLPEPEALAKSRAQKEAEIPPVETSSALGVKRGSRKEAVIPPFDPSAFLQGPGPSSAAKSDPRKEAVIPPWDPSAFLQEPNQEPVRKSSPGVPDLAAFLARASSRRGSRQEPDTPMPDATASLQVPSQEPSRKSSSGISDVAASLAGSSSKRGSRQETDTPMAGASASSQGPGPSQVPPKRAFPGFSDLDAFLSAPTRSEKAKSYAGRETATASRDTEDTSREEDPACGGMPIAAPKPRKPIMETFEDTGDLTDAEDAEILERVRPFMKTPPLDSLPKFNCKKPFEDEDLMKEMDDLWNDYELHARIRKNIVEKNDRVKREQEEERQRYKERQLEYRRWTEFSMDEVAVKSREKFAKSRAKAAAEAAALQASSLPSNGGKPEGQRRTGSRWATEHDIERVMRESEQEAKESKEREERAARAKTASAKEATIPDMCWSEELWNETRFHDKTHLVPFDRSFARLEYGEPIDNFTEEECRIFEEVYLEFPKQWSKIAEALPDRDYKACIQHYYLVKHKTNLKEKLRKQPKKKKGRKAASKNPKSNALMADLGLTIRDETEEGQDTENGERRRPRRAAAPTWPIEAPASESEVASPAPTPSRKTAATPKGDANNDAPPNKRKTKAAREKGSKQTKNNQLLAAAPTTPANRQPESPAPSMPPAEWKNQREPSVNPRVPQFDGPAQNQSTFTSAFVPVEKPSPATPTSFETKSQPVYAQQERLESAPPMGFEQAPDRRAIQQTSSYWSVPEQTDFPALLKHFGTDWHGIAKHMTSKTHIMVYTNLFKTWLAVPSDSNKSRLVANIQTQVKNYYQRQVDSGKMKEWEEFTREADARKERGEIPPDLPPPTMMPKRRYDITPGTLPRSGSSMDLSDDLAPPNQNKSLSQASPPQPSLSSRFPALAQAGPVPQIQPATPTTVLNKHLPPQPIQQAAQQVQQTSRLPRGPALGYFTQSEPRESRDPRPIMQANTPLSERSLMAAQEAHAEQRRAESIRLKHEQSEQQQQQQAAIQRELMQQQALQQQALQRERQSQMKQESEAPDLRQFEAYPAPQHGGSMAQPRPELPKATPPVPTEQRRTTAPPHQFQPRSHQPVRNFLGENIAGMREIKSTPSPAGPRPPMSAPPTTQEQYSAPPPSMLQHPPPQHHPHMSQAPPQPTPATPQAAPPQPVAPVRQQETVRKTSSIMSLLNDEPSDPRPAPTKRVSDVSSSALQPSRTPPPPQHSLQGSRYVTHPSQAGPQATQMPQQLSTQPPVQQQTQLPPSQLSYGQPNPHPLHQHSSSIGHSRSYTPTGFDRSGYSQAPIQQQQQQPAQQLYSQPPPRSTMTSQPPPIRRESSMGEIHGVTSGYARTSAPSQSRLKESPYSQPTPPPQAQALRQLAGSPLDLAPSSDRDYYQRQAPYLMQQQQQQSATSSPQPGPYHPQSIQQPQPSHRQLAFGQGPTHVASPPPQYAGPHTLHRSRHNSFDGRFQMTTSAPGPAPQGYAQAPQHQPTPPAGPPLQMQYQQQHPSHDRYESSYERERRIQEEAYQRRLEEQRRMDDPRR